MKKKLLAGILALALCSTNMPIQTIFAGEFTSGNPDIVSEEETPEIFTNEEQEAAGETDEELSVFSSEEVPEFNDTPDEAMATAENAQNGVIDLTNNIAGGVYTIISAGDYKFTCKESLETSNRIVVDGKNISAEANINIYLDNVNINTSDGPALKIADNINAKVTIYLTGKNNLITTDQDSAGLQKNNKVQLIITSASNATTGSLKASGVYGAGIGSSYDGSCDNITINSGFIDAKSEFSAGIGGGYYGSCDNITINSGSVNAESWHSAGIGGGYYGSCNNITVNGGSVTASSANGTDIGGKNSGIIINGGSVKASSVSSSPANAQGEVYCCTISNPQKKVIRIDGDDWGTYNHVNNKDLYAWLTGETHTISVGDTTQTYYFNKKDNTFVPINFTFAAPQNLVYDGQSKNASLTNTENIGDFTLSYYNEQNELCTSAINAGTYIVKANIDNDTYTFSDLVNKDWTFTIKPRNLNISIVNKERKYGEDNPELTYLVSEQTPLADNDTTDDLGIKLITNATKLSSITDANTSWSITMDSYTNKNYNIKATSGTLTINPATFDKDSIKITAYSGPYDGSEHPVINENSVYPDDSKVEYSTETGTPNWNTTCPKVKNVSDSKKTKEWIRISKDNYEPWLSGEIQAIISPTQIENLPLNPQISVPWTCKKVADITTKLPTNWNWQDSSKDLQIGSNSVIAVYTGSDAGKGNYVKESVKFEITRSKCTHEHTAGRYYSSPSCTSNGYSGDTYCKDCNETISYGYTISAYGHDYDNGVITTEPTAETDGIITYTCKWCKHQDTKNLGKLGDGEPYIEGSFQKKGWDAVNDLIKASKEKDTISITLNGAKVLPASVLSGIKGKDISLNLNMENGFIWKINGTSITAETPADTDLSVTNTAEYIPAALYSLISTNQNDFGFHLGRSGAFDFPAVLSVKADASCAGLMANLFWYDVKNGVLQCIQLSLIHI